MKDKYIIVKRNVIGEEDFYKDDGFYWEYRYKGVYNDLGKVREQINELAKQYKDIEWNTGTSFTDKQSQCEILAMRIK